MSHQIRLKGFWERLESLPGRIRFSRSFGRPTIEDDQLISAIVTTPEKPIIFCVNGKDVERDESNRYRLPVLNLRNRMELEFIDQSESISPEVIIEID